MNRSKSTSRMKSKTPPSSDALSIRRELFPQIQGQCQFAILAIPGNRSRQPLFQRYLWRPIEQPLGLAYIGPGRGHVGRMGRSPIDNRLASDQRRDLLDQGIQRSQPVPTEVDDFVAHFSECRHRAARNIVDVGEIALLQSVAEYGDRLALIDAPDEAKHAHVRPARRTIDCE